MKRSIFAALTLGMALSITGCLLSDIAGWDLSTCAGSGLSTCTDLFFDNQEKILGGKTLIETLLGGVPRAHVDYS